MKKLLVLLPLVALLCVGATIQWFSDQPVTTAPADTDILALERPLPHGYKSFTIASLKTAVGFTVNNVYNTNYTFAATNFYRNDVYVSNYFWTNVFVDVYNSNYFTTEQYYSSYPTNFYITNIVNNNSYVSNYWSTNVFPSYVSNYFVTNLFSSTTNITLNTFYGSDSWTNAMGFYPKIQPGNLALGFLANYGGTGDAAGSTAIGVDALGYNSGTVRGSVFVGSAAGDHFGALANNATFVGPKAGKLGTGTMNTTVGIGSEAFASFTGTTAFDAVAIGNQAFSLFTGANGVGTVSIGAFAGAWSSDSLGLSVLIGDTAGFQNSGYVATSIGIGNQALAYNSGNLEDVVVIGHNAHLSQSGNFTNSVAIGPNADITANNQFVLGSGITDYVLRGISYKWPAADVAGSLISDGSGNLIWSNTPSFTTVNVISNVVVKGNLIVSNLYLTNGFFQVISTWAGPTNGMDCGIGYQEYAAFTPCAVTVFSNGVAGFAANSVLSISNASSSNITLYITAALSRSGDFTNSYTITNANVLDLSVQRINDSWTKYLSRSFP